MSKPEEAAQDHPRALQCVWEVTAGIIPGEAIDEYTRRWPVAEEPGTKAFHEAFLASQGTAMNYALSIQDPRMMNWVRMEWVWT